MRSFIIVSLAFASVVSSSPFAKRADGFQDPTKNGGSWLDKSGDAGEPLNVVISGSSASSVLSDEGFLAFSKSIKFSTECFGLNLGSPQTANLGDGEKDKKQLGVLRQDFGDTVYGTCLESLTGGHHYRFWKQNGTDANTGAWFLAASEEEDISEGHTITPDGYNRGRDRIVRLATAGTTNGDQKWKSSVEYIQAYDAGSTGINHNISVDGRVAILTVFDA